MDQSAIDELAQDIHARAADRRAPRRPASASQAEKLRRLLRGDGCGRQARRRAHRRHQDRRQARRRSGLCAAARGPRLHQPGPRAAGAHALPIHGMRDQLPPHARSAGATATTIRSRRCSTRWKACAAFELVDSRFRDLKSAMDNTPYEFYADHIANGAMVFGRFRNDWQKFDFTKTRVSMKQGGKDHHRKDRRPSDRQSGQARRGAGQPPAQHDGTQGGHVHRDRLVHRLSSGRA